MAACLTDIEATMRTRRCTDTYAKGFNQCKDLINSSQVMKPWNSNCEESKYLRCDASDIGLDSCLRQGTLDRMQAARFHSRTFNLTQLNFTTFQKELLEIMDTLLFFEAQLGATTCTILTNHKPLQTFMDRTQQTQKLHR